MGALKPMRVTESGVRLVVTAWCLASLLVPMTGGCSRPAERSVALRDVDIVGQRSGDGLVSDGDIEARTDEPVVLHLVVRAEVDGEECYYSDVESLQLQGKTVRTQRWPRENGPLRVQWYSVRPRLRFYVNRDHHNDKIQFVEQPVRGVWSLTIPHRGGTYRFRVQVSNRNGSVSTPGIESETQASLLPGVRRVSIRENRGGGDNIDFMTMFFNVAYVLGNTQSQVENFIGIDCQDLCIYGLNRTGWNISYDADLHDQYRSHIVFDGSLDVLGRAYDLAGQPTAVPVRRGDVIHFPGPNRTGHYGAVYADRSLLGVPNGKLDFFDDVIHTLKSTQISKLGWVVWPRAVRQSSSDTTAGKGIPRCRVRVLRFERRA